MSTFGEIMDDKNLPLLDRAALERLRDELDDEDVCKSFVRNFIALLPDRAENVRRTLTKGDVPRALDAVLSLETSSQMVGAERLAELATDLERPLRAVAPQAGPASSWPRLAADNLARITKGGRQTTDLLLKSVA